jgi:putative ABC transport system permease protein
VVNFQVLCLYAIGLPIGLLVAAVGSFILVPAMAGGGSIEVVVSFSPIIFIGGAVFTFLTAYLGAYTSARKAARVSPVEAIRYAGEQNANFKVRRSAKGKPNKMAFRNVFRERKRAFVVLISLFLGVSVFTVIMTIVNSIDIDYAVNEMYAHDFTVANEVFESISMDIVQQINAIPGIKEFRPDFNTVGRIEYDNVLDSYANLLIDRHNSITYELLAEIGIYFPVRGVDDAWVIEWNSQQENPLNTDIIEAFMRGEVVLMDESMLKHAYGITTNEAERIFPIGMMVDLELGWDELDERIHKKVMIGGFANLLPNARGMLFSINPGSLTTLLISANYLQEQLGENLRLTAININVADGECEVVFNSLNEILSSNMIMVSRHEARLQMAEARQSMFVMGAGLSAILGAIGIFNFINVISVGLLVRKREFAALESVGMAKRQMRAMLRWEGAIYWILTLFAALTIGNAIALGLFTMLGNSGEPMFSGTLVYPTIPITAAYVIIILICSITPEVAYKNISKLTLVERLREAE